MVSVSIIQTAVLVASIIYNGGFEQPSVNYMLVQVACKRESQEGSRIHTTSTFCVLGT